MTISCVTVKRKLANNHFLDNCIYDFAFLSGKKQMDFFLLLTAKHTFHNHSSKNIALNALVHIYINRGLRYPVEMKPLLVQIKPCLPLFTALCTQK